MKNLFFRKEIIRVLLTIFIWLPVLVYGYAGGSDFMTQTVQEKVIRGRIVGNDGAPLPGVNVTIKGTLKGVISDSNGNYSLSVPDNNAVLSFSFIGFTTQDISVGSGNVIDVVLQEELKKNG